MGRVAGRLHPRHVVHGVRPAPPQSGSELYRENGPTPRQDQRGKATVARKVLIAARHVLSHEQPFEPCRRHGGADPAPARSQRLGSRLG